MNNIKDIENKTRECIKKETQKSNLFRFLEIREMLSEPNNLDTSKSKVSGGAQTPKKRVSPETPPSFFKYGISQIIRHPQGFIYQVAYNTPEKTMKNSIMIWARDLNTGQLIFDEYEEENQKIIKRLMR